MHVPAGRHLPLQAVGGQLQLGERHDARVVHEDVEPRVLGAEGGRKRLDACERAEVERHGRDPGLAAAPREELFDGGRAPRGAPAREDDLRAALRQAARGGGKERAG